MAANPTGLERWFKLEARSHRSSVQGRIKLKLWISSRNDHGMDDDMLIEISKLESLYTAFIAHEISVLEPAFSWTFNGDITGPCKK